MRFLRTAVVVDAASVLQDPVVRPLTMVICTCPRCSEECERSIQDRLDYAVQVLRPLAVMPASGSHRRQSGEDMDRNAAPLIQKDG